MSTHQKERALRLAKELYPEASIEDLIIYASKMEAFIEAKESHDSFPVFARKCTVQHPAKGYIAFEPYAYQKEVIDFLPHSQRIIINTARQMGTSYMLSCYGLWKALSNPYHKVVMGSSNFRMAQEFCDRILMSYDHYSGNKPGLTTRNKSMLEFSNGSKIIFKALTPGAMRGHTVDTLIVDNAAYVSHSAMAEMLVLSATGAQMILASTPNIADGPFYELWSTPNDWLKLALPWHVHEDRDQSFKQHMQGIMSANQWSQEFECKFTETPKP